MLALNQLKPGDVIAYHLLPEDMPLNPNKVWRGKVVRVDTERQGVRPLFLVQI